MRKLCQDRSYSEYLRNLFARFSPRILDAPLSDFSKLNSSAADYCEVSPRSANEVSEIVQLAAQNGVLLRVRGHGHALNGSSLPQPSELVVQTRELTEVRFESNKTVSAGAGRVLWSVDAWLQPHGYSLPVLNEGYAGPSVGGYVAAGGFGLGSEVAGGFWDNVAEVTVINGEGRILRVSREAPLFPWLFGSMGQLGIIVEAKLDIVPRSAAAPLTNFHPINAANPNRLEGVAHDDAGRLFWFTLFVLESKLATARTQLDSLEARYCNTFAFRKRYTYFIPHRRVVAPLLWPYRSAFYFVGSWGILENVGSTYIQRVMDFDADFTSLALANGYRRYVQTEVPSGPALYKRYFGPKVYSLFNEWKRTQDPYNIINRRWVFEQ
jgi:FAD/FMN-containing dehydrogenase